MTGPKASLARGLAAVAPLAAFAALFALRPRWLFAVVGVLLALGVLLLAAILALFAFQKFAPGRVERLGFRVSESPAAAFVGRGGVGVRLRIVDRPGAPYRVEWGRGNYLLLLGGLALFGPGLTTAFLLRPPGANDPAPALIGGGLLSLAASVFLVTTLGEFLFHRPSLTVEPGALILRRGGVEARRFGAKDIADLAIQTRAYLAEASRADSTHDNFALVAHLVGGGEEALCVCDRRDQIEAVAAQIRLRLGLS